MGTGRLRDRAYEGFLGEGSVVILRLGGYLGVGPASRFQSEGYDDWLVGSGGKILWGTGDQNGSYIELREDGAASRLGFSADITVKKSLALNYHVWFVNGPILTIDVAADSSTVNGSKGLLAGDPGYKFYGNFFESGGQNPSRVEAKIIVLGGSGISRSFLTAGSGNDFIAGPVNIPNGGAKEDLTPVEYGRDSIRGYLNWKVP
jgi:hypothetical protein